MKKRIIIVGLVIFLIISLLTLFLLINSVFGDTQIKLNANYNELFSKEELQAKGHVKLLSEYLTDTTIGYENRDGSKTIYFYAAPIQYTNSDLELSMIDTRLVNVKDKTIKDRGYAYTIANSDIASFFPSQLSKKNGVKLSKQIEYEIIPDIEKTIKAKIIKDKNFIGEQKMQVLYKNALDFDTQMRFYPSFLGTNCEIVFNENIPMSKFSLFLKIPDTSVRVIKESGGYLSLNWNRPGYISEIVGLIQKPLMKSINGDISYNCSLDFTQIDAQMYKIDFILDSGFLSKGTTVFISFEMRREKQPDNAIYSKLPDLKYANLNNYSVIGNSE